MRTNDAILTLVVEAAVNLKRSPKCLCEMWPPGELCFNCKIIAALKHLCAENKFSAIEIPELIRQPAIEKEEKPA